MWNPINRTRVQVEENEYRIYDKRAPINYKKSDGTFDTIDHTFNDTTSSIGAISLMDKGIVSVGKRKGNNPHKVVGIRPDTNQHLGTQQLEFSLIDVELDGVSQSFNVETDLEIKLESSKVRQLVKTNKDFNDFKIEFDIYAKGLELQNSKYSNTTTIREDFGFNITNLGNVEGGVTDKTFDNIFTENRTNPYIDVCVFQITNNYITTGQYSNTEEFGDSDLSNYVIDDSVYPNGGAAYLKDCIVLIAKMHNIEESIEDIFVNQMCNEYGLETIWEEEKNGQYFTKDGKKVASYYSSDNQFYMFINTKEIPDDIKTLFQRKTFNDTSFLNITLSDFNTTITNRFNQNTTIELNTDYYEPIQNLFAFKISNHFFFINPPTLYDENYNILDLGTTHSLKQNDDGSYRYTKYFSMNGYLKNSHNIKYIDADLAVDQSDIDIVPGYSWAATTTTKKTSTNLTTTRDATSGTFAGNFANAAFGIIVTGDRGNIAAGQSGTTRSWNLYQTVYKYDTSGLSSVTSATKVWPKAAYATVGGSHSDIDIILLKGALISFGNASSAWNRFAGHTSGWDASDVTEYSSAVTIDGYEDTTASRTNVANYVQETAGLNSDALTDMNNNSIFQFHVLEYEQYYLDSIDTSYGSSTTGRREFYSTHIDHATTADRPYIQYSESAGSGYTHKVLGVAAGSIGKVKNVATANIGKVIGVD